MTNYNDAPIGAQPPKYHTYHVSLRPRAWQSATYSPIDVYDFPARLRPFARRAGEEFVIRVAGDTPLAPIHAPGGRITPHTGKAVKVMYLSARRLAALVEFIHDDAAVLEPITREHGYEGGE